jgi:hypothetical protein
MNKYAEMLISRLNYLNNGESNMLLWEYVHQHKRILIKVLCWAIGALMLIATIWSAMA